MTSHAAVPIASNAPVISCAYASARDADNARGAGSS
jgi:hypothetical protein